MGTVSAAGLGKFYKRYPSRWSRLAEWLDPEDAPRHEKHWVLHDVSFDVRPGESIGIVGENGAGKSTLLKIITGTTQPSVGSVEVSGRLAALLELGMGFHPEFTGRQNAYIAGQLLGYSNEEIAARMSEIEAFAEIGDYLDQPTRTYSSGMQVRLAFSVATAIRPDILIVDEALSVGDIFFQQKCYERIRQFREEGTTLLFVTHSLATVYSLCDRAFLLDHGALVRDADPKSVIDLYQKKELERLNELGKAASATAANTSRLVEVVQTEVELSDGGIVESPEAAVGANTSLESTSDDLATGLAVIDDVEILCGGIPVSAVISDTEITIAIKMTARTDLDDPHAGFQIRNARGEPVFMTNTHCMAVRIGPLSNGQSAEVSFSMKLSLAAGEYTITAGVANGGQGEGMLSQALVRRHASAVISVAANRLDILWSGVCNLHPSVSIVRLPTGSSLSNQLDARRAG